MQRISRRRFVTTLGAFAAAPSALAGCASSGSNGSGAVSLSFWSWVPGIDKAVAMWNQTHPHIHVELQVIPGGTTGGYAKMHAALAAGNPPNLAQIEYQEIPSFLLDGGLENLVDHGVNTYRPLFVDWQWKQVSYVGGVYAIPQASGPMGLFYRKDVFASIGLPPPATWADYAEAARRVHDSDKNRYIVTFPPVNPAWFTSLAWQAGAQWFGTSGDDWLVQIDSPQTIKVAEYWDKLRQERLIKTEPDEADAWYRDIQDGSIVTWPAAQWCDALLQGNAPGTSGRWAIAPLPQWTAGATASSNWGGSSTAIMRGTPHIAEALEFAVWLNTNTDSIRSLFTTGYGWPAAVDAFSSGAVVDSPSRFYDGQRIDDVFIASDRHINESWMWPPTIDTTYNALQNGFESAVAGHGTFVDAVISAQRQTISEMKSKGVPVRG